MAFPPKKPAANGSAVAKKKAPAVPALTADQRRELCTFTAPDDMKPSFYVVVFGTDKDGYFSPSAPCGVQRVIGRIDSEKQVDLFEHDPTTVVAIFARLAAATAATNPLRRLKPLRMWRITLRASSNKDSEIITGVKSVEMGKPSTKKPGTVSWGAPFERPEKDSGKEINPDYRKLLRAARLLRGAFVNLKPLPVAGKRVKRNADE